MPRISNSQIADMIGKRESFTNHSGTVRGIQNPNRITKYGELNNDESTRFKLDQDRNGIAYVVLSYQTPIAWVTSNGWVYKVTQTFTKRPTARHQGFLYLLH